MGDLPDSADVVVIGAGAAGLAVAGGLARSGAQVVVLEAHTELGAGFSGRHHGCAGLGYADHPVRLARSLGDEQARELVVATAENLALMDSLGLLWSKGVLTASMGDTEAGEMAESIACLERWGLPVEGLGAAEVSERFGGARLGPGWVDLRAGAVDPVAALESLAEAAQLAGATVVLDAPVRLTRDGESGTEVVGAVCGLPYLVQADVVVHASGQAVRELDPFFGDKVYPVRFQTDRLAGAPSLPALSAQLSYLQGAPRPDGSYVLGGCRWATPHLEAGEHDGSVRSPAVDAKLEAVRRGALGAALSETTVVSRQAGIMAFTCDGLPIVGPIPGRVGHIACVGWNGRPWSHALRAAQAVCDGLLTGRSPGFPSLLSPQRFI